MRAIYDRPVPPDSRRDANRETVFQFLKTIGIDMVNGGTKVKLRVIAVTACLLLVLSAQAALAKSKLVLYTSQPNKDAQQTVDGFMAQNPDVEVSWVRDGTTKMMAKLRAEFAAGAPPPGRAAHRRHGHHGGPEKGRPVDGLPGGRHVGLRPGAV